MRTSCAGASREPGSSSGSRPVRTWSVSSASRGASGVAASLRCSTTWASATSRRASGTREKKIRVREIAPSFSIFDHTLFNTINEDLEAEVERGELQEQLLVIIPQESQRLSRMINQLLDLSRIEAGKMEWRLETLDLSDVVTHTVQANR